MSVSEEQLDRLAGILRQDAELRAAELARLNEQLEERTAVLERDLARRARAARWYTMLMILVVIGVGVWVYLQMHRMAGGSGNTDALARQIGQMQVYMKNMGGGTPRKGEAGFMASMAHDIDKMSNDIGVMRGAMEKVAKDIGVMRRSMQAMRDDIGAMNGTLASVSADMNMMNQNVDTMARSIDYMTQSVSRLTNGGTGMRGTFPPMNSVMPWP